MIGDQIPLESDPSSLHFATDHLKVDLAERSLRSGLLTLSSQAIKFGLGAGSMVILARLLTPVDYGVVGMVAIVLNFVVMFQHLGLSRATVQWPELNHRQVSNLFWINVSVSVGIAILMTGASPVLGTFFNEPRVVAVTIGYAPCILITGLSIQHEALLARQMRFSILTAIDVVSLFAGLSVAILTAWRGAGYWALVYNQLTIAVIQGCGYWSVCRWRPGLPSRGSGIRPILLFGGHFTGANLMNFFSRNLDNVLIGRYWGARELGLYSRSYQLLRLPLEQILTPVSTVAIPALSRLSDEARDYKKAYLSIIEKIAMVTMPGITLICATSDWLVLMLLGPQWAESGRIFMFLGIAAVVQPITGTCPWLLSTQGRTREMFIWSFVAATISILSICIGLRWGAIGVAASYALFDLCLHTPLLLWYTGRKGPVRQRDFYATLMPSICASLGTLTIILATRGWMSAVDPLIVRMAIALILTAITTVAIFLLIPSGRTALRGFVELIAIITKTKGSETVPPSETILHD